VDDQPSIRGVLQVALEEAGGDVWTAGDGLSALVILDSALPDIILLDLAMPGMDGWSVLKALKASARTARIPVVFQTSTQDLQSYTAARREGVAAFLSKPFRLNEVVETCRRILDGARPLQGKPAADAAELEVQLRDTSGNLIGLGQLLDLAPRGAQVELESPLAPTQAVTLLLPEKGGSRSFTAEVRWVRKVGERFHHGLVLREE
jgi:CheY-like chemotaxis protein